MDSQWMMRDVHYVRSARDDISTAYEQVIKRNAAGSELRQ